VQPGYDTAEEGRRGLRHFAPGTYDLAALDMIRDLGGLTRAAAERGAELVVWPEAALWVNPRVDSRVRPALRRLATQTDAAIVVPFFLPERAQGATVLATPGGALSPTQPKQRPMWFLGEDGGNRREPTPVRAPGGLLGTLLGVDDQDPASGRRLAGSGATVLATSTHDWEQLAVHHRAHARLHALATGAPLVRADWRYGSAIYDRDGRQVASAPGAKRRVVLSAQAETTPAADEEGEPRAKPGHGFAFPSKRPLNAHSSSLPRKQELHGRGARSVGEASRRRSNSRTNMSESEGISGQEDRITNGESDLS